MFILSLYFFYAAEHEFFTAEARKHFQQEPDMSLLGGGGAVSVGGMRKHFNRRKEIGIIHSATSILLTFPDVFQRSETTLTLQEN